MSRRDDYRLDSLVRSALRAGSMRPTPFGLHGRIWRRLEIAAMVDRERARFRAAVRRACAVVALLVLAVGAVCWVWSPFASVTENVPGLLGLVDYGMAYAQAVVASAFTRADFWMGVGAVLTALAALVIGSRASVLRNLIRRS